MLKVDKNCNATSPQIDVVMQNATTFNQNNSAQEQHQPLGSGRIITTTEQRQQLPDVTGQQNVLPSGLMKSSTTVAVPSLNRDSQPIPQHLHNQQVASQLSKTGQNTSINPINVN